MSDTTPRGPERVRQAKVLLVLLSFAWGVNWPAMKISLNEVTPWTMRLIGYGAGTLFLFALVRLRGRSARLPPGPVWRHVVVSAFLNVFAFGLFASFAQLAALTSRVVIVAYSMPVWTSLLAWLLLGERLNVAATLGLLLCGSGLALLIYPLASLGIPLGLLLALGSALSWAAGTIYLKWAHIPGDRVALCAWQMLVSLVAIGVCLMILEGTPHLWPLSTSAILALAFHGFIGTGVAYFLWFDIIGRLPAATASLGSLCVPVVGVLSSVLLLGDRPTLADAIGFTLIFAAAACVLVPSSAR